MRNCCSAVLSWRQSSSKAARGASATHWHGPGIRPAILGVAQALRRLLSVQGCATYRDGRGIRSVQRCTAMHRQKVCATLLAICFRLYFQLSLHSAHINLNLRKN